MVRDAHGGIYAVEALLGKGGFGAVYVVRDRRVRDKLYALKELVSQDRLDRECFLFEGELLKRLDHPALPHVYSVFENKKIQRAYMLMDYIQGQNLAYLRKEQPGERFALPVVLSLLAPVVDALTYLHGQSPPIVHRDIKPGNIIVPEEGNTGILVDFGTAKEYDSEETTTVVRHVTSGFAAPEQYMGGTNPRTDIYGLGATVYSLLSGQTPPDALVRATRSKGGDPLQSSNLFIPGVPVSIVKIIQRAMSLNNDDRYQSVEEFWQQLRSHAPRQPEEFTLSAHSISRPLAIQNRGKTPPASVPGRRPSSVSRTRPVLLTALVALILAAAVGAGFLLLHPASHASDPTPTQGHVSPAVTAKVTTTTQALKTSIYPALNASYAGTAGDLMTNESTRLLLANIQQGQGSIRGSFQGLGLTGPFKGTVTPSGQVQFTVTVYGGNMTLNFEGTIKIGGDMAGSFTVLDQNGQRTGEAGIWNVAPGA